MIAKLLSELSTGIWAIRPEAAQGYMNLIVSYLKDPKNLSQTDHSEDRKRCSTLKVVSQAPDRTLMFSDAFKWDGTDKLDIPANSIVTIPVLDGITKYDQYCGPTGMQTVAERVRMLDHHPNVAAIMLQIDSPGGEGYAARLMVDQLDQTNKPVIAFIDDLAASAAYMIASATDLIIANSDLAQIGSIGTYIPFASFDRKLADQGIDFRPLYATASKDKNKTSADYFAGHTEEAQAMVDQFNESFLSSVENTATDGCNVTAANGEPVRCFPQRRPKKSA